MPATSANIVSNTLLFDSPFLQGSLQTNYGNTTPVIATVPSAVAYDFISARIAGTEPTSFSIQVEYSDDSITWTASTLVINSSAALISSPYIFSSGAPHKFWRWNRTVTGTGNSFLTWELHKFGW